MGHASLDLNSFLILTHLTLANRFYLSIMASCCFLSCRWLVMAGFILSWLWTPFFFFALSHLHFLQCPAEGISIYCSSSGMIEKCAISFFRCQHRKVNYIHQTISVVQFHSCLSSNILSLHSAWTETLLGSLNICVRWQIQWNYVEIQIGTSVAAFSLLWKDICQRHSWMLQKSSQGIFTQTSVSSKGTDSTWNGCLPQDCPTGSRSLTQLRCSILFISSEVFMTNPAVNREPDLIRKGSGGFMFRRSCFTRCAF